jgi:flagellar biogenesis protein FliO
MNPGPPEVDLSVFAVIGALALLAGAGVWWLRSRKGAVAESAIQLVALRSLGGKRLLALVEVEQERFLLGLTDESISCLGRLDAQAPRSARRPLATAAEGA